MPRVTPRRSDRRDLVDVHGASQIVGLAPSTLNKLRCTGGGPPFLKVRARVLYRIADLDRYLAGCRKATTINCP